METAVARTEPVGEAMEIGEATAKRYNLMLASRQYAASCRAKRQLKAIACRARVHGIPITQKKRLKIQRKKKADGINTLHKKKKKKGKRK